MRLDDVWVALVACFACSCREWMFSTGTVSKARRTHGKAVRPLAHMAEGVEDALLVLACEPERLEVFAQRLGKGRRHDKVESGSKSKTRKKVRAERTEQGQGHSADASGDPGGDRRRSRICTGGSLEKTKRSCAAV